MYLDLSAGLAVIEVGLWPGLLLWDGLQTVAGQATVAPRARDKARSSQH